MVRINRHCPRRNFSSLLGLPWQDRFRDVNIREIPAPICRRGGLEFFGLGVIPLGVKNNRNEGSLPKGLEDERANSASSAALGSANPRLLEKSFAL